VEATVSGTADVAQASRSLLGRSDAILLGPDGVVIAGLDGVAAAALADGTPLYAVGADPSTPGLFATMGPDYPELGTAAGNVAVEVLQGADPGAVPFAAPDLELQTQINGATLEQLGIELPADVAAESQIVG